MVENQKIDTKLTSQTVFFRGVEGAGGEDVEIGAADDKVGLGVEPFTQKKKVTTPGAAEGARNELALVTLNGAADATGNTLALALRDAPAAEDGVVRLDVPTEPRDGAVPIWIFLQDSCVQRLDGP